MKKSALSSLAWLLGGSVPRNRADLERLLELASGNSQNFSEAEIDMLRNVLSLPQVRVEEVMIPHGKVDWLYSDDTFGEVLKKVTKNRHSRYPVIDTKSESVLGILHVKRLVGFEADPKKKILLNGDMLQEARTVPESKKLDSMLREFKYYRVHMAVVADEGAKPAGMVTIEDVLEHIVGAIRDEFDSQEATISPIRSKGEQNTWEVNGDTPIERFNEHFGVSLDEKKFGTVNGWVANLLGRMPEEGEEIKSDEFLLKVTGADARRVSAVEVVRLNSGSTQQAEKE